MAKRKGMGKKARFTIFMRDNFTCCYCGRTPPEVVLHVDHFVAVANGGTDEESNLVTSCLDCNLGKGATAIDGAPSSRRVDLDELRERAEQMEEYNRFLMDQRADKEASINQIGVYWFNQFMPKKDAYVFGTSRAASVRRFMEKLPVATILEAIDIAFSRKRIYGTNDEAIFKYFCGICWNMISNRGEDR